MSVIAWLRQPSKITLSYNLAAKYAHHEVYEVQPGVQMTAKFAANGLVCEMKVEQEHFLKDKVDMRFGIDRDQIDRLVDQLVPASERGGKDKEHNGMSIATGQVSETVWRYADSNTQASWLIVLTRQTLRSDPP